MYCNLHGQYNCGCMQQLAAQQQSGVNSYYENYIRDMMRQAGQLGIQQQQARPFDVHGAVENKKAERKRKLLLLLR